MEKQPGYHRATGTHRRHEGVEGKSRGPGKQGTRCPYENPHSTPSSVMVSVVEPSRPNPNDQPAELSGDPSTGFRLRQDYGRQAGGQAGMTDVAGPLHPYPCHSHHGGQECIPRLNFLLWLRLCHAVSIRTTIPPNCVFKTCFSLCHCHKPCCVSG